MSKSHRQKSTGFHIEIQRVQIASKCTDHRIRGSRDPVQQRLLTLPLRPTNGLS